jgi:hypothetical protein
MSRNTLLPFPLSVFNSQPDSLLDLLCLVIRWRVSRRHEGSSQPKLDDRVYHSYVLAAYTRLIHTLYVGDNYGLPSQTSASSLSAGQPSPLNVDIDWTAEKASHGCPPSSTRRNVRVRELSFPVLALSHTRALALSSRISLDRPSSHPKLPRSALCPHVNPSNKFTPSAPSDHLFARYHAAALHAIAAARRGPVRAPGHHAPSPYLLSC